VRSLEFIQTGGAAFCLLSSFAIRRRRRQVLEQPLRQHGGRRWAENQIQKQRKGLLRWAAVLLMKLGHQEQQQALDVLL